MTSISSSNQFDIRGYNHVAMVCSDMQNTVDFYEGLLGFPLVKTLEIGGHGQHFFFQVTETDGVAFFFFQDTGDPQPGLASADWSAGEMSPSEAKGLRGKAAKGAMHHLSFDVPAELIEEYRDRLLAAGVDVTDVITHTDENGVESIKAIYFRDPDGIVLEFSAWTAPAPTPEITPARASEAYARRREGIPLTV